MKPAFDTPILAGGLKPLRGVHAFGRTTGEQMNRFGFVLTDMAIKLGDLFDMREADLLRSGPLGVELPAFPASAVHLAGPGHRGCYRARGKTPPEWRPEAFARSAGFPFGCL